MPALLLPLPWPGQRAPPPCPRMRPSVRATPPLLVRMCPGGHAPPLLCCIPHSDPTLSFSLCSFSFYSSSLSSSPTCCLPLSLHLNVLLFLLFFFPFPSPSHSPPFTPLLAGPEPSYVPFLSSPEPELLSPSPLSLLSQSESAFSPTLFLYDTLVSSVLLVHHPYRACHLRAHLTPRHI